MSHLSYYQVNRCFKLFDQFTRRGTSRLAVEDLHRMIPFLGQYKTMNEARDILRKYDRDHDDEIDFEDFLQLFGEYEQLLEKEKVACRLSFEHFRHKYGRFLDKETFIRILKTGKTALTAAELTQAVKTYFPRGSELVTQAVVLNDYSHVQDIFDDLHIPDHIDLPHQRTLTIIIKGCYNARFFTKLKSVGHLGVQFDGFDPFITVRCANAVAETAILIQDPFPVWECRMQLTVTFPTSDTADLCRWVDDQFVSFTLWDHVSLGPSPHNELLGFAYIPLASALQTAPSAVPHLLQLTTPYMLPPGVPPMVLEAIVQCDHDGLYQFYRSSEDAWFTRFRDELDEQLSTYCLAVEAPPVHQQYLTNGGQPTKFAHHVKREHGASFNFFKIYNRQYKQLRHQFKRRHLRYVQPDEDGVFRPTCSHLCALRSHLTDPRDVARNIARLRDAAPPFPHMARQVNRQCAAAPSMVLTTQRASLFERAVLLCSLFIGLGLDAYIATGHSNKRRNIWVVTFEPPADREARGTIFEDGGRAAGRFDGVGEEQAKLRRISRLFVPPDKQKPLAADLDDNAYDDDTVMQHMTARQDNRRRRMTNIKDILRAGMAGGALRDNFLMDSAVPSPVGSETEPEPQPEPTPVKKLKKGSLPPRPPAVPTLDLPRGSSRGGARGTLRSSPSSRSSLGTARDPGTARLDSHRDTTTKLTADEVSGVMHGVNTAGRRCVVVHWDVSSGRQYIDIASAGFPYTRLGMLANDSEMYTNVQRYDLLTDLDLDMSSRDKWRPFLGADVLAQSGQPGCWWAPPMQLMAKVPSRDDDAAASVDLTSEVVDLIQRYRQQAVFALKTKWFRPLCQYLHEIVPDVGPCWTVDEPSLILHPYQSGIIKTLPPHVVWYGRPHHIKSADPIEIVEYLSHTGILDCTTEGVAYAIGVRVFSHSWGIQTSAVWIGYLHDIYQEASA